MKGKLFGAGWVALVALVGIWMLGGRSATDPKSSIQSVEPAEFSAAKAFVAASMKDPDSVRFGQLSHGKGKSICGLVNAKNGYGGYTGMEPFVYSPERVGDEFYIYEFQGPIGHWGERGEMAEIFQSRGCSIGPDQDAALNAIRAIRDPHPY